MMMLGMMQKAAEDYMLKTGMGMGMGMAEESGACMWMVMPNSTDVVGVLGCALVCVLCANNENNENNSDNNISEQLVGIYRTCGEAVSRIKRLTGRR